MGMIIGMRRHSGWAVVCAVLIAHASFSAELVEELEDDALAEKGTMTLKYNKISGFALRASATAVKNKDLDGCQAVCTGQPSCRSISYRANDKTCLWSTDSLNFDPQFILMTKALHSSKKKYRTFPGMTYRSKGWLKAEGKSKKECIDLCTKSKNCLALSYRRQDMTCLMSGKGITYSPDFNYYEKSGMKVKTMPLKKQGGAELPDEKAKKAAAAKAKKAKGEVGALMTAEERKLAAANKEIDQAKKMEADAKKKVAGEKAKTAKEIADAKAAAKKKLGDSEAKFSKDEAKKMAEKGETMKLQFASAELKQKASHTENKADREKERTAKAAADVKAHAARKAARAVAAGAQEAAQRVEKAQLSEKLKNAQKEQNAAQEKKTKASMGEQRDKDKVAAVKEVEVKKGAIASKEQAAKKLKMEGMS